jgi:hypothetical protein
MADGRFVPGDPKLLSFAILGAVNWITRWFDPEGPATSTEIGRVFADYLIRGLEPHLAPTFPSPRRRRAP